MIRDLPTCHRQCSNSAKVGPHSNVREIEEIFSQSKSRSSHCEGCSPSLHMKTQRKPPLPSRSSSPQTRFAYLRDRILHTFIGEQQNSLPLTTIKIGCHSCSRILRGGPQERMKWKRVLWLPNVLSSHPLARLRQQFRTVRSRGWADPQIAHYLDTACR